MKKSQPVVCEEITNKIEVCEEITSCEDPWLYITQNEGQVKTMYVSDEKNDVGWKEEPHETIKTEKTTNIVDD